jgi:ketosteroid isomerase-like protein
MLFGPRLKEIVMTRATPLLLCLAWLAGCAAGPQPAAVDRAELPRQVAATERAFAKTMADRDHAAFVGFLAEETVWFASGDKVLRGKQVVAEAWKPFYEGPQAPFSWEPTVTEVLDSGTLALTSGPVYDPSGKQVANFMSIWRQESPGVWRIVFDRGCAHCPPRK